MANFNSVAEEYAQWNNDFPTNVFDQLIKKSILKHTYSGVDLGSGEGFASRMLASKGISITGIEPSEELRTEARKFDAQTGLRIKYLATTPENTTFPSASLDFAIAVQTYHGFERDLVIPEIKRILKPEGHFIIVDAGFLASSSPLVTTTLNLVRNHAPDKLSDHASSMQEKRYGFPTIWFTEWNKHNLHMVDHWQSQYTVSFSHKDWRGKVLSWVRKLDHETKKDLDKELAALLLKQYPHKPLMVPHMCSIVVLQNKRT